MNEDVKYIEHRLHGIRGSKRRFYITFGAAVIFGALCAGLIVFSAIDLHVSLPLWLRSCFFGLLVASAVVLLGSLVVIPLLYRLGILKLTWDVETAFPELRATLATTVEYTIDPYARTHYTSDEMKAALAGQTRDRISRMALRRSVRWTRLRWPAVVLVVVLVGMAAYVGFVPSARTAVERTLMPWEPATYTRLSVKPGDTQREELSDLTITADLAGRIPDRATIHFENDEGEWTSEPMAVERDKARHAAASFEFTKLARPFSYYVEAGDATSPHHMVIVYPDPKIDSIEAELTFPAYTELPKQTIKKGDLVALRGTAVTLTAKTNTVLGKATLVRDDGTELPLTISQDARSASGSFVIARNGKYQIIIEDTLGHVNRERDQYEITAIKDTVPDVRIVHPGKDEKVLKTAEVPIEFEVADDFGIDEIGIAFNVKMEGEVRQVVQKFDSRMLMANDEALLMLEIFPLEPHDLVSYYVYAIDNDAITGPKEGFSNVYFVEIMPYEEKYRLEEGSGMPMPQNLDVLNELIRIQREIIQKTFSTLNLMSDPIDPDVEERILGIASLQLQNAELAKDFAVTFQNELLAMGMESEIYKVKSIEEAATAMEEAVGLLQALEPKAAADPEQLALAKLYKALSDLEHLIPQSSDSASEAEKKEKLRQALELAQKKAEEQAREREAERQRELEEKKSTLEELKERQQNLNKDMAEQASKEQSGSESGESEGESESPSESQSEGSSPGEGLGSRQKQLAQETKSAAQELGEMAKKDPSLSSKAPSSTEKAAGKMDEAAEELEKPDMREALKEGIEAEKLLDRALEEIALAEQRNLAHSLERLARDLDEAARDQDELKGDTAEAEGDTEALKKAQARQDELKATVEDLAKDAESIAPRVKEEHPDAGEKVAKVSEKLSSGDIQGAMSEASAKISSEGGEAAQPSQEEARADLRETANLASEALRAMSKTDKEKLLEAIAKAKEALGQQRGVNRDAEEIAADPTPSTAQKAARAKELSDTEGGAARLVNELVALLDDLGKGEKYKPETKDFREARREMTMAERYLSEGNLSNASASGEIAEERLAKGLDELRKLYGSVLLEDLAQAIRDTDRVKEDQERVRKDTEGMKETSPTEAEREKTALREKWVADDTASLEEKVRDIAEQAETAGSEAKTRIDEAGEKLASDELKANLEASRSDVAEGRTDEAAAKQGEIVETLADAKGDLERAYKILTTSELERDWASVEELGKASEELAKMREQGADPDKMAEVAKTLDEEAENLSENEATEKAGEHARNASEMLDGDARTTNAPMSEQERIEYADKQIEQAIGVLVKRIDVLVQARKILLPKDETCPPEYQALVEYYYKVLSEF